MMTTKEMTKKEKEDLYMKLERVYNETEELEMREKIAEVLTFVFSLI